jgi:undecaprenyl-diphosphatase
VSRVVLLSALAFVVLTVLVTVGAADGVLSRVDDSVSTAAVEAAEQNSTTTRVAQTIEAVTQPVWVYLVGLVGVVWAWFAGRRAPAVAALCAGVVAAFASPAIKALVDRARPALDAGLTTAGGGAFPSGHVLASTTVVLLFVLLLVDPAWRGLAAVVGAVELGVVAVDRVWLGAHWPTDVLGGWLLALVIAGSARQVLRRSGRGSERDGDRARAARGPRLEGGR